MTMWAARRIGDEAAHQFDRGFERGRWPADLTATRLGWIVHDSGFTARVRCKEAADAG